MLASPPTVPASSTYIPADLAPIPLPSSLLSERVLARSPYAPALSSSPASSQSVNFASPEHAFQYASLERHHTPITYKQDFGSSPMQTAYPSSPPQAYGITGGLIVSEPASMLQDEQGGTLLPTFLPRTSRPAARPFSPSAPSPPWPRRVMSTSVIDPAVEDDQHVHGAPESARHEANTPSLSHSTTSTSSAATHPPSSHPPYGYPHYTPPYTTPSYPADYPYHASPCGAPAYNQQYPQPSPWAMSSAVHPMAHRQQPAQYPTWGAVPPATTMPSKQDEPILGPGELPAPRPPMSYAALIGEALLLAAPPHQLYVSEISDSIKKRYPYYRQNPTKIYNGVRHQTSMCKAFVKLPRPYGCQSASARKWGIRAGCESWFAGGGYHPPNHAATTNKSAKGGKAKSTARSKQLAIGTNGDLKKLPPGFPSPDSSDGPSSGPAYDGSSGAVAPYQQPYGQQFSSPQTTSHLPPGYHYVPVNPAPGHPQPSQPIYVPVWGPYAAPNPPQYAPHGYEAGSQSPEMWRRGTDESERHHPHHASSYYEPKVTHHGSSYDEPKAMPHIAGSPAGSQDSYHESMHSSQPSPEETL
ncbi:hypothetical protein L198_03888 [Cryptococcus wingfieldii CBS 7118]|uniref:Fork-head domain-containing protein n=1 Tax=Cryptococcus wingfieldii CBS 7118 TaxID=1295528 RepID=A0A1E3J9H8_9TREE|nr:hypothetical protein L198_03888 [Cryptococcus wingfieldii CBS 7118]ODN97325.1 hypothetical protein L198_03888 [Cryptococcus wingfieldii CBS 7118]